MGEFIDFIFGLFGRVIITKRGYEFLKTENCRLIEYELRMKEIARSKEIKRLTKKEVIDSLEID